MYSTKPAEKRREPRFHTVASSLGMVLFAFLALNFAAAQPTMMVGYGVLPVGSASAVSSIPVSSVGVDVVNAPANVVVYGLPDWQTGHPKPAGVGYANMIDWTALGFVFGTSKNTQIQVLDTDGTYFNQATGAPTASNRVFVLFGGPGVNAAVHYFETAGISPLYYQTITVSGTLYAAWYDRAGNVAGSLPLSGIGASGGDMFLIEYFRDPNGNRVFIIYGFGGLGTLAGGTFFRTYVLPNMASLTHGWYVFQWNDTNGNGLPEPNEITTTPVKFGD